MANRLTSLLAALLLASVAHGQVLLNKFGPVTGVLVGTAGDAATAAATIADLQPILSASPGLVLNGATGGPQGPGTINAPGLYVNGAAVGVGGGAVSLVALGMTGMPCTVAGSPVTSSGTLSCAANTESANTVWAGPTTGAAVSPTFRALASADVPPINLASTANGGVTGLLPYASLSGSPSIPTVSGTTGFVPVFTGASALGNSGISWDSASNYFGFNQSTTFADTFEFDGTDPKIKLVGVNGQTDNLEIAMVVDQGGLRTYGGYFVLESTTSDMAWVRRVANSDSQVAYFTNATGHMTLEGNGANQGVSPPPTNFVLNVERDNGAPIEMTEIGIFSANGSVLGAIGTSSAASNQLKIASVADVGIFASSTIAAGPRRQVKYSISPLPGLQPLLSRAVRKAQTP